MDYGLVSIVIPAYNASDFLAEAIDSALAQTYKNIEIIVVNDGSCDDGKTRDVALSYGHKIKYYEKENGGCASSLNYGIEVMSGEWFSWLSHDDVYLPEKIEKMFDAVKKNNLPTESTALVCDTILINKDGNVIESLFKQTKGMLSQRQGFYETLIVKTFNGCGMLIPKAVIDKTGLFITEYKHLLDREYWMRMAINGCSFYVIDENLVKSRVHNKQITVLKNDLLYNEEETLISDYFKKVIDGECGLEYARALCIFAYKRKHGKIAMDIKKFLVDNKALNIKDRYLIAKYYLYGKFRLAFGNFYRNFIRR